MILWTYLFCFRQPTEYVVAGVHNLFGMLMPQKAILRDPDPRQFVPHLSKSKHPFELGTETSNKPVLLFKHTTLCTSWSVVILAAAF